MKLQIDSFQVDIKRLSCRNVYQRFVVY